MSLLSFTGVAGYFMFTSYGISLTSGLHVSIIDAALPLVTILFSAFFLKEKSSLGFILLSTFLFAFYTILLKRPKQEQYLSNKVLQH